jgi:hypothetical protein
MALLDRHDDHSPERPAHLTGGEGDGPPPPTDAKKKHKENMIIIVLSLVGVIITYLIYRSSQANAASSTVAPVTTTGTVAGSGSDDSTSIDQLTQQLEAQQTANQQAQSGLSTMISNLESEITGMQASPGGTLTPTVPGALYGGGFLPTGLTQSAEATNPVSELVPVAV